MTATAHTLVAGAIASKFPDPIIASSFALLSHFIMDAVPHWDIGTNWRNRPKQMTGILAIGETSLGLIVGYLLFQNAVPAGTLIVTMIASLLPDWLETPWYILFASSKHREPGPHAKPFELFTYNIYKAENFFHTRTEFPLGLATQVVTVLFFLFLLT